MEAILNIFMLIYFYSYFNVKFFDDMIIKVII